MKIRIGDDIIFEEFENRADVHYAPELFGVVEVSRSNYQVAELLSWLKSFYKQIFAVRLKINVKELLKYPENDSVKDILKKTIFAIPYDFQQILEEESTKIVEHYRLTENWRIPFEIVILTHRLPVPPFLEGISIHLPEYFYNKPKNLLELPSAFESAYRQGAVMKYPALYFTRKVSANELVKWLKNPKNRKLFENIQYKLPRQKEIDRDQKTIFWGQVAWILKQDGINSWAKMTKAIEKLLENNQDNLYQIAPEPVEIQKYYERFVESLHKIDIG